MGLQQPAEREGDARLAAFGPKYFGSRRLCRSLVERATHADYLRDMAVSLGGSWTDLWRELFDEAAIKAQLAEASLIDWRRPYREALVNKWCRPALEKGLSRWPSKTSFRRSPVKK